MARVIVHVVRRHHAQKVNVIIAMEPRQLGRVGQLGAEHFQVLVQAIGDNEGVRLWGGVLVVENKGRG